MGRSSPRAGEYRHVYRNRHCALCNGIPPDKLQCGRLLDIPMLGGEGMSFSVLFDFSDRSGSDDVGAVDVCKGTSVWDPFFQKCREVFCDNGQLLDGDTCAPKNKPATSSTDFTPFQYCPKFYLSPNEFENRSDGSVYVQLYDQRYAEGEFELRDGELVVCSKSGDFSKFDAALGTLSLVFVVVSIVCLCCHLALFWLVPEQRNLPGKNLAALCACLLVGYICFVAASFQEPASEGCRTLGVVMYAAFMASFFWMNVMAFDVFMSLRRAVTELRVTAGARLKPFLRYALYTVTATACLVTSAVITDSSPRAAPAYRPGFGERVCWFSRRRALLVFFAVPLLVIMVANMALFVGSALIVRRAEQSTARVTCSPSNTNLRLCGRLAVISGLSWLVGLLAGWADFPLLWHIFIVLNTLQGVFIFGSFTVKAARSSALRRRRLPRQAPWSTVAGGEEAGTGAGHGSEGPPTSETDI
ncbi:G-protein coupled receptor Mth2 [Amphibalanus amphitrite]|uniref:G-protein coupled receptor Mth2 n=1 Tax=Amphibalanus amphitrite TaxID=1232801 RepID=A0A6A4WQT3_AMPAM|nr:G-protein coupled receptor Mth2 [Amphibalanus amphitrite]